MIVNQNMDLMMGKEKREEGAQIRDLPTQFTGRGEVSGFQFVQIDANDRAFLYEVRDGDAMHYEVFKKVIRPARIVDRGGRKFNVRASILYPKAKSFGIWAFSFTRLATARLCYDLMSGSAEGIIAANCPDSDIKKTELRNRPKVPQLCSRV